MLSLKVLLVYFSGLFEFGQNNWLPSTLLHCELQCSMLSYLRFRFFDAKIISV